MIGKVINTGNGYVVKNQHKDLPLNTSGKFVNKVIDNINKDGFVFIEFEVETVTEGTNEFDFTETDVASVLKIYNDDFGTNKESISSANYRHNKNKYPIGGFAPGFYSCRCLSCNSDFIGDKRAVQCEICAINMMLV
jgi:hypothetical protein